MSTSGTVPTPGRVTRGANKDPNITTSGTKAGGSKDTTIENAGKPIAAVTPVRKCDTTNNPVSVPPAVKKARAEPKKGERGNTSLLNGIGSLEGFFAQDIVSALRGAPKQETCCIISGEFCRAVSWRLRGFTAEEINRIYEHIKPMGSLFSKDYAVDFLSETLDDILSGISLSHEVVARIFIKTDIGLQYLAYAEKTK